MRVVFSFGVFFFCFYYYYFYFYFYYCYYYPFFQFSSYSKDVFSDKLENYQCYLDSRVIYFGRVGECLLRTHISSYVSSLECFDVIVHGDTAYFDSLDNVRSIINRHDVHVLSNQSRTATTASEQRFCNCQTNENCPLQGNCLDENHIYQADVTATDDGTTKKYIGITANPFKTSFNNHRKSFRNAKYSKETDLSSYIRKLKNENREYSIKWSILKHAKAYGSGNRRCNLCLDEKMFIMKTDPKTLLNKRSEIFAKCRHRNKHCLRNIYCTTNTQRRQNIPRNVRNNFCIRAIRPNFFQLSENRLRA